MMNNSIPKIKNNFIKSNPLFIFFIFLISGFFLSLFYFELFDNFLTIYINYNLQIYFIISLSLILINIYIFYKKYYIILYIFTVFTLGFCSYYFNFFDYNKKTISFLFEPKEVTLSGEVTKILKVDKDNMKFLADCKIKSNFLPTHKAAISINLKSIPNNFKLSQNSRFDLIAKIRTPKFKNKIIEFDETQYAQNNNIKWFAIAKYNDFSLIESQNHNFQNRFYNLIYNRIISLFEENYQPFIISFILGDNSALDYNNKNIYAQNGTAHIFAVSGLNIGIYVFLLLFIFSFIKSEKLKYLIISILLVIYCYLINYPDSTVRTIFIIIFIFYISTEHLKKNYLNILFGFISLLFVFFPSVIDNIGMQYSVAAFGSIILFNNFILDKFNIHKIRNKFSKSLINSLIFSFSVSILILPLNAYYFNSFNLLSIIINLISIPVMSLCIFYSLISIIISFISFDLAIIFAFSSEFLIFISNKINYLMFDLGNFINIKNYSFEVSLIFSIFTLIILFTKKINLLFFRFLYFTVFLVLLINFNISNKIFNKNIIDDNYFIIKNLQSSSIIYEKKDFTLIIYEQRKFYSYYKPEFDLINFINQHKNNVIFIYSGDLGYELIKYTNNKMKHFRLKLNDLEEINSLLKQKHLYKKV